MFKKKPKMTPIADQWLSQLFHMAWCDTSYTREELAAYIKSLQKTICPDGVNLAD